ncbi:MAG TPA: serine protease [Candidatus Polarisedimenticolia bacterium]|nr:serine protease [Candidatus Polarisedimenticolia bacterium]
MSKRGRLQRSFLLAVCLSLFAAWGEPGRGPEETVPFLSPGLLGARVDLPAERFVPAPAQMARASWIRSRSDPWTPRTGLQGGRGPAGGIYRQIAPSVAVVRTAEGYGTGFLVDAQGWVLTNQHVIAGAETDPGTGSQRVALYWGRWEEGRMSLVQPAAAALVYKESAEKDLALLKVVQGALNPDGPRPPRLAAAPPVPGALCVAIGHPRAGMFWTVRECQVSAVGTWPRDMVETMLPLLGSQAAEARSGLRPYELFPERKVVVSSCGLNPGDSGGPLLNEHGELIGVSYGIPLSDLRSGVTLDKFSYHVHVEEVSEFIASRPEAPLPHVPDPWPPAVAGSVADLDGDGQSDSLLFSLDGNAVTGFLLDLDQDSRPALPPASSFDRAGKDRWDFEVAVHLVPPRRVFFDLDGVQGIERVESDTDGDGRPDAALERGPAGWTRAAPRPEALSSEARFADKAMHRRLVKILDALGGS